MTDTVFCKKFKEELPALAVPPMPGKKGQELLSCVSQKAWDEWKSHQNDFRSSFEIRYNTFIIIAADESNMVSGCSIDSLVNFIRDLENSYSLQLLDKLHVKYIEDESIQTMHLNEFKVFCKNLKSNQNLIVFNNLVKNIYELENNWEVDIKNSWHKRFLS